MSERRWPGLGITLVLALAACSGGDSAVQEPPSTPSGPDEIRLVSPAFEDGGTIPVAHTCDGRDTSPPLEWSGGPRADSYALVMNDPDAPGGGFVHWVVFDIGGSTTAFPEGAPPDEAIEGSNSFGDAAYGGPCPPEGDAAHRYVFTLYALEDSSTDELQPGASVDDLFDAIECCIKAQGVLTGTYGRT